MDSRGRSLLKLVVSAAVLAALMPCAAPAQVLLQVPGGQIRVKVGGAAEDAAESAEGVFLPPDRSVLQQLSKAKELLAQQRYGEAVRYLGAILDGPEDYFFQPDKDEPIHRSLKAEAQRLIGEMPRKGRELYELQYGARGSRCCARRSPAATPAGWPRCRDGSFIRRRATRRRFCWA